MELVWFGLGGSPWRRYELDRIRFQNMWVGSALVWVGGSFRFHKTVVACRSLKFIGCGWVFETKPATKLFGLVRFDSVRLGFGVTFMVRSVCVRSGSIRFGSASASVSVLRLLVGSVHARRL